MVQIHVVTASVLHELMDDVNQRLQELEAQGCTVRDIQFRYVGLDAEWGGEYSTRMGVMIVYDTPPQQV